MVGSGSTVRKTMVGGLQSYIKIIEESQPVPGSTVRKFQGQLSVNDAFCEQV